jgi:hypothetical protein
MKCRKREKGERREMELTERGRKGEGEKGGMRREEGEKGRRK